MRDKYDTCYDNLRDIRNAWDIYTHYNDITDKLKRIGPASTQASELIAEQRQLELAFEEYGALVDTGSLGGINWDAWDILWMLESVKEGRMKSKDRHNAKTPSSGRTDAKEPTPPAQAPKAIDTPPKPHPSKSEEPAPKPPTSKPEETTPNTPEEPMPPSQAPESQAKAATPPQEVKPETENTKTSETTIPEREPNGPTSTPNRHPGKTEEAVSTPFTYPTEAKKSAPLQHPTKANDTTPPPQASKQQEPTPKLEPTSMQGTGGGKTTGGLDTSQTTEGNVGNIRDTKDSKMSSGHLIIGRTVIQIMVAVVLMAAL
ncbi:hypothetical protein, conserved [Babesia ovata]|uniref:Uncharacterized protein n=1 Tax=Babesia ovata TaxID=189622 RepID=A0A2H6KFA5_9APIC|nr:uncharacterized protein BOVATA_031710 [Babesia ovata]GBE61678.1 hypothetical protein, conserved [Babesia ovata]